MKSDDASDKKQEYKYTYFGSLLRYENNIRIEFFHDVWLEFSNTDFSLPPSIIYNDWLELMRISNIYDPFDEADLSFLDKDQVMKIYNNHAGALWKFGVFALSFNDFAEACRDLGKAIYPYEEDFEK